MCEGMLATPTNVSLGSLPSRDSQHIHAGVHKGMRARTRHRYRWHTPKIVNLILCRVHTRTFTYIRVRTTQCIYAFVWVLIHWTRTFLQRKMVLALKSKHYMKNGFYSPGKTIEVFGNNWCQTLFRRDMRLSTYGKLQKYSQLRTWLDMFFLWEFVWSVEGLQKYD